MNRYHAPHKVPGTPGIKPEQYPGQTVNPINTDMMDDMAGIETTATRKARDPANYWPEGLDVSHGIAAPKGGLEGEN